MYKIITVIIMNIMNVVKYLEVLFYVIDNETIMNKENVAQIWYKLIYNGIFICITSS